MFGKSGWGKLGYELVNNVPKANIASHLQQGHGVLVQNSAGHWALATGITKNTVNIIDPGFVGRETLKLSNIKRVHVLQKQ